MGSLRGAALSIALVAAGAVMLLGGLPGGRIPIFLLVPLALAGVAAFAHRGTTSVSELRWAGAATARDPAAGAPANALAAAPPRPATRRAVAAALGRAEARQWVRSPSFAIAFAFCVLQVVLFGFDFFGPADSAGRSWRTHFVLAPIMAHPMVGLAVIGAHAAVTRGRRDRAEELFASCPTSATTRTEAHLRSAWVPAATVAAFVIVVTAVSALRGTLFYGRIDGRALADTLAAVVLGACGAALGVALGRWAPWRLVPIVVVAALVPVILELGNIGEPHWSNTRQLSTWPRFPPHDLAFTAPPVWWHLLWLAALGALVAFVAVLRSDRSPRVLVAGAVVVAIAVGAGIAETRPLSGRDAVRLASLVVEPERNQTCRSLTRATVCVYRGYEAYITAPLESAAPVAAATPASLGTFTFRQGFDGRVDELGPEVARRIGDRPIVDESVLPLGYETGRNVREAVRLRVALRAVGLPARIDEGAVPTLVEGEARGVVAVWLATRGLGHSDALHLASSHYRASDHSEPRAPTALDRGMAWPDPCQVGPAPVLWSPTDLVAARALLAASDDDVADLLQRDWARFTAPGASTDELLVAAGLEPLGPPERVSAVAYGCSY